MTNCPRCHQPLSDPPERFCIHCGAATDAPPPEGVDIPVDAPAAADPPLPPVPFPPAPSGEPPPGAREGTPWDCRGEVGFVTALVDTTLLALGKPRELYGRMAVEGGLGGPLAYGVIVGTVGLVATTLYDAIFRMIGGPAFGGGAGDFGLGPDFERAMQMLEGPGVLVQLLVGPIALVIGLMFQAAVDHLALKLVGGASRPLEATFRVVAYSRATAILSLVPLCGPFVAFGWGTALAIIGLQTVHGTTLGKAAAAVLLPITLACCCLAGAMGLVMALAASAVR